MGTDKEKLPMVSNEIKKENIKEAGTERTKLEGTENSEELK